jgi:hypothetical protein
VAGRAAREQAKEGLRGDSTIQFLQDVSLLTKDATPGQSGVLLREVLGLSVANGAPAKKRMRLEWGEDEALVEQVYALVVHAAKGGGRIAGSQDRDLSNEELKRVVQEASEEVLARSRRQAKGATVLSLVCELRKEVEGVLRVKAFVDLGQGDLLDLLHQVLVCMCVWICFGVCVPTLTTQPPRPQQLECSKPTTSHLSIGRRAAHGARRTPRGCGFNYCRRRCRGHHTCYSRRVAGASFGSPA